MLKELEMKLPGFTTQFITYSEKVTTVDRDLEDVRSFCRFV